MLGIEKSGSITSGRHRNEGNPVKHANERPICIIEPYCARNAVDETTEVRGNEKEKERETKNAMKEGRRRQSQKLDDFIDRSEQKKERPRKCGRFETPTAAATAAAAATTATTAE